ncbi:MAG: tetratricopeptide repeat protein [Gemmataceae bacterium]
MRLVIRISVAVSVILAIVWIALIWNKREAESPSATDPRLTFPSRFRNVKPEVNYVGDEACARCHEEVLRKFCNHPMGRSITPVIVQDGVERLDPNANNPFETDGFRFRVERANKRLIHYETRLAKNDAAPVEFKAEVQYAIGSGTRARSYLINQENRLYQSALTWYSQRGVWDLSPGFSANPHSDRPITAECLFCHANQVVPVIDTVNHFRPPLFRGEAIGCERCHGPGQLHVELRQQGQEVDGVDETIVNPRHLEPRLREAVCDQCHLQGALRVLRRGRDVFDFRPGLPLGLFWSVFVNGEEDKAHAAVSQVEQMRASRCYLGSAGKLGCISCHDPHETPLAERKADFYQRRCLMCHETTGCSLDKNASLQKKDDCVSCHMSRATVTDIPHTAITNHFIQRHPGSNVPPSPKRRAAHESSTELIIFQESIENYDERELRRDQAIAAMRLAQRPELNGDQRNRLSRNALTLLDGVVESRPDDIAAWEARSYALSVLNRKTEALAGLESVLDRFPERESILLDAAFLAGQLGRRDLAVDLWRRCLRVNPFSSRAHFELAKLLLLRRDAPAALLEAQETIRLHPFHFEARKLLITCYLEMNDRGRARKAFDVLLNMHPPDPDGLRRAFLDLIR